MTFVAKFITDDDYLAGIKEKWVKGEHKGNKKASKEVEDNIYNYECDTEHFFVKHQVIEITQIVKKKLWMP